MGKKKKKDEYVFSSEHIGVSGESLAEKIVSAPVSASDHFVDFAGNNYSIANELFNVSSVGASLELETPLSFEFSQISNPLTSILNDGSIVLNNHSDKNIWLDSCSNFPNRREEQANDFNEIKTQRVELNNLESRYLELKEKYNKEVEDRDNIEQQLIALTEEYKKLNQILYLEKRIHRKAWYKVKKNEEFLKLFENYDCEPTAVISIDIRKSTELMLKAKSPQNYSNFIVSLSEKLKSAIIENFGVFDKFTGDGILAFFPSFYSGRDSLLYALKAAEKCHDIFNEHYRLHRSSFSIIYNNIGLGIGIDFGETTMTKVGGDLTVVGHPVVYACRLSSAPSNKTYLNQNAIDELLLKYKNKLRIQENIISIKNESEAIVYQTYFNWDMYSPKEPEWYEEESK